MSTVRKTITVTKQQGAWIKSRIKDGDFTNDSEYLRDLIRRDQERAQKIANMQRLITEGIESGISDKTPEQIMEEARGLVVK
ncbi:MAG: type II toxin-antitoxin system ParD family antitoxin [Robiginitomaculum sp.]|nr:type II toxin-antitoxin system ParD family antitoxin [Robiginitomaculum sp.]MDQ7078731.1 type II toxin-antitoxin system ParD family antitoxin [Robiginitomaculum sp.]